jgi:hypothetical protein
MNEIYLGALYYNPEFDQVLLAYCNHEIEGKYVIEYFFINKIIEFTPDFETTYLEISNNLGLYGFVFIGRV